MRFVSTRGRAPAAHLRSALLTGLAPDGGLYVPEVVPRLEPGTFEALRGAPLGRIGATVLAPFVGDALEAPELEAIVAEALSFPLPLVELEPGVRVLELFHGPTGSFKDVGARFLARLLSALRREPGERIVVLVATSGDTGGAVAHAFHGVEGVETVVLFPEGRISPVQLGQIAGLGGNVRPLAVRGSFDDCQRLVKEALGDPELRNEMTLSTGNSINLGRLLPQAIYYVSAWTRLPSSTRGLVVSVPCGNLGNLTAGVLARRLGLPVTHFVAATNANDTFVRFLASGALEPIPSRPTLSSAMDVTRPSNLERLLHLAGSVEGLRREVTASAHDDAETLEAIGELQARYGYAADPHTAVGWLALEEARRGGGGGDAVLLATADPAKFPDAVARATGERPDPRESWARIASDDPEISTLEPEEGALRDLLGEGRGEGEL